MHPNQRRWDLSEEGQKKDAKDDVLEARRQHACRDGETQHHDDDDRTHEQNFTPAGRRALLLAVPEGRNRVDGCRVGRGHRVGGRADRRDLRVRRSR